jgi:hypothetical protein
MSDANPSRLGSINEGADKKALFLKVFSGEVLANFQQNNVFLDKTTVRTIASGKSSQFPATGIATTGYHTPGSEILGDEIKHAERVITIDDLLTSSAFIANIDEAMNHYEVRSTYSSEIGHQLAKVMDANIAQVMALTAREAATITGEAGGTTLANADYPTDSAVLAAGLFDAQQTLDEKNVPDNDRNAFFLPAQYYLLAQNVTVINQWYDGKGSISEGTILKIAGLPIVKTNAIPQTNVTTGPEAYKGDFSKTVGLVAHKGACGTVKLLDMSSEMEYDIRRQGTLMVSKYAVGHGILRPEAAVELASA